MASILLASGIAALLVKNRKIVPILRVGSGRRGCLTRLLAGALGESHSCPLPALLPVDQAWRAELRSAAKTWRRPEAVVRLQPCPTSPPEFPPCARCRSPSRSCSPSVPRSPPLPGRRDRLGQKDLGRRQHNAFTDLIRFGDRWYCSFREADDHVGGDGQLRVLTSTDGENWTSAALLGEAGIDLRDPKLSITADGRLMIVAGGSVYNGGRVLLGRQPRVSFSADGKTWTPTQRVLAEGDWLWRVTWHKGKCYGIAYDASKRSTPRPKKRPRPTLPPRRASRLETQAVFKR